MKGKGALLAFRGTLGFFFIKAALGFLKKEMQLTTRLTLLNLTNVVIF